jgi:hypothetical protein
LSFGAQTVSLRLQKIDKLQVDVGRLPADTRGNAVEPAQMRGAKRQHDERAGVIELRLEARHQRQLVGRRQYGPVNLQRCCFDADLRSSRRASQQATQSVLARCHRSRHDPVVPSEIAQVRAFHPAHRMAGSCDHDIMVGEKQLLFHIGRPIWPSKNAEQDVEFAGAQIAQQILIMPIDDLHAGRGIFRQQFLHRVRQDLRGRVRNIADGDAGDDVATHRLQLFETVFDFAERNLAPPSKLGPYRRGGHAARRAPKQASSQLAFQLPCGTVQGRLGNLKRPCGRIE